MVVDQDAFDKYCASLTGTNMVVQWGGTHVWKVGSKIFAVCGPWGKDREDASPKIAFKCSDLAFQILTEQSGIVPALYLGRYKWVQVQDKDAISLDDTKSYIEAAHALIAAKLSKAERKAIGL